MLRTLTRADVAPLTFAVAIVGCYGLLPLWVVRAGLESEYFFQLARISLLGGVLIYVGSRVSIFDRLLFLPSPLLRMRLDSFLAVVSGAFALFVLVACVTAERIPFIAALQGVDVDTLAVLRERFLKAREGWQTSFVYVNAVLAGALVPYSMMLMLLRRHRFRWILFGAFLLYSVSFVEKVFFLKAAIPLLYLVLQNRIRSVVRPRTVIAAAIGCLAVLTVVSGAGNSSATGGDDEFFSTAFVPQGPFEFIGWRTVAVPIVTAADALKVHDEDYNGRLLMGATSTLIAGVCGLERVAVERDVFAAEWGQNETETGNANSVFLTEGFLNFGWTGVVLFSLIVGLLLRLFAKSSDEAFRSLWMVFGFGLFVAPLTGMLFSNGFLIVMLISVMVSLESDGSENC